MIFLENEYLKAGIAAKGAELQQLESKETKCSYLWSGDAKFWGKFSPVLFPIVGALKNGTYQYQDQTYSLPRHGFARDQEFSVQQISPTEAEFSLHQNEATLAVYPFNFLLQLHYQLSGNTITCTYKVSNTDKKDLLFSIGGHPAFATAFESNLAYTDCYLKFDQDTVLNYHKISGDLIANDTVSIALKDHTLPLSHELFYDDALVFKSLKSHCISLLNHKNKHGLDFNFQGFPFFGIWAAKNADFICLEPWQGIADGVEHNQQLQDKEGITQLAPQEKWSRTWSATCY